MRLCCARHVRKICNCFDGWMMVAGNGTKVSGTRDHQFASLEEKRSQRVDIEQPGDVDVNEIVVRPTATQT